MRSTILGVLAAGLMAVPGFAQQPAAGSGVTAFTGASLYVGTGPMMENAVLLVRNGKVEAVGPASRVTAPPGARRVDLAGKFVTPGWILGHGHVGGAGGPANPADQLRLYARYGVTTVASLGGEPPEAFQLRDSQNSASLDRARIFLAGAIVTADTPGAARQMVDEGAAMKVNFIKIRVDDNLGATPKMTPAVYQAVIDQAHNHELPVYAHLFYLDDAKGLLRSRVDLVAHSIRDREVDPELIDLLKQNSVCVCPTLTREVSTFVYESTPAFFSDPFFLREADPAAVRQLLEPQRQAALRQSQSAQRYKKALEMASANLKKLVDAGVKIAFGTDSGPPGRFQGYFEHMEMELMAKAGLTPEQVFASATRDAALCLKLTDVGTLEPGKWADFNVYTANPLADVTNSKTLESVWIAGNRVPAKTAAGR